MTNPQLWITAMVTLGLGSLPASAQTLAPACQDHGIAARMSESRGHILTEVDGRPTILALAMDQIGGSRICLLVIDALTGETEQYWHPEDRAANSASYALLLASTGRFYVTFGSQFLEFDPRERRWTFAQRTAHGTAMSWSEAPDGTIYAGLYPSAMLLIYDPHQRSLREVGPLDPTQQYVSFLEAGDDGWVYAGIGTQLCNLVAYRPADDERRPLADEATRRVGGGWVTLGVDGHIYGRLHADTPYLRLRDGAAIPVERPAASAITGAINWQQGIHELSDGRRIKDFDLPGRTFTLEQADGSSRQVTFDYESGGANITSLAVGPGGVYGSTSHPMTLFRWDAQQRELVNLGRLARIGGGNICSFAAKDHMLYGAAYGGGLLVAFDTGKPWNGAQGDAPNPAYLLDWKRDIGRPRVLLLHPDRQHLIMGGFPGYGLAGGGLGIFDTQTGEAQLLTHEQVVPGQATVTLRALPDGNLVGGTSTRTPGGAARVANEAVLYILDWNTRQVVHHSVPVAGASDVSSIELGPDGRIYGISDTSQLFVFDLASRSVVHREDLSAHGHPPRFNESLLADEHRELVLVMDRAVLRITAETFVTRLVSRLPFTVTGGSAISDGRLFHAVGSHLWSCPLPP